MPTILDIARMAGVSKSTVSRVLTGGGVSPGAEAAVREAIGRLGYTPNQRARNLVKGRTRTVGIVIADVADPYFVMMLKGAGEAAAGWGYDTHLYITGYEGHSEMACLDQLRMGKVDGLLLLSLRKDIDDDTISDYFGKGANPPVVAVNRPFNNIDSVSAANRAGARCAVSHLMGLGHRRIALISGPERYPVSAERHAGWREALEAGGPMADPGLVAEGDFKKPSGVGAMKRLLDLREPPTAVMANDPMALGAWSVLRERGLRVPEDMALVGFDNLEYLGLADIPLTTVHQPRYEMGRMGMDMLLSRIEGVVDSGVQRIELPTRLIIRGSCGGVPGGSVDGSDA